MANVAPLQGDSTTQGTSRKARRLYVGNFPTVNRVIEVVNLTVIRALSLSRLLCVHGSPN